LEDYFVLAPGVGEYRIFRGKGFVEGGSQLKAAVFRSLILMMTVSSVALGMQVTHYPEALERE